MSMPKIEKPENPIDREQSINNLIESVALMETGLSHVINAEGEKIQKVIKHDSDEEVPLEDILKVNESVGKMVNSVSKLEMILQNKLDISKEIVEATGIPGPTGPEGPQGPAGESGPFRSSYLNALGYSQTIPNRGDVIFSVEYSAGNAIEFNPPGDLFTINESGLYNIEWNINLADDNANKSLFWIVQNGTLSRPAGNSATTGVLSSGATINVTTVPFMISLRNGSNSDIILENVSAYGAASIRIVRFADSPSR